MRWLWAQLGRAMRWLWAQLGRAMRWLWAQLAKYNGKLLWWQQPLLKEWPPSLGPAKLTSALDD
jgi:hypothetical protein